jgi:Kef-type K+ transport system membrane component KefB
VLGIALIVALSHVLGLVARRLWQPAVVGHIFAGILLGPSVLGKLPGHLTDALFPRQVLPYLTVVSQVALVLFLFSVGYELDRGVLRQRMRAVPYVAAAGFVAPMLLGVGSTVVFAGWYSATSESHAPRISFVLFVAVALSITAVPVLAEIIRERGLVGSVPGVVAMTSAGVMDALGWLALAAAILQVGGGTRRPWPVTVTLLAGYVLVMVVVLRPLLRYLVRRAKGALAQWLPVVTALAMGSAWFTGVLGLHVIFGAFLAGMVMPRRPGGGVYEELEGPLRQTGSVLLPVFFVVSGLSTDIGALRWGDAALLGVVCVLATAGKWGVGTLAARAASLSWRESNIVGVLLNTRGLTELIALNVGLQAGIISKRLYTVFVLMALVTTVATGPLLAFLLRRRDGAAGTPAEAVSQPAEPVASVRR